MKVELDAQSLSLDGRRRLWIAGSFDYFRLPASEQWPDRIARMRDAGLDAVRVAYPWTYHSQQRGEYDFAGERDVDVLHDLIEEAGMALIAAVGPYIGGGLDLGGLPGWLLREPDAVLRCRDRSGYAHSTAYVEACDEWLEQIVPRVAQRAGLMLVEVENRYCAPGPLGWLQTGAGDLAVRWLGTRRLERIARRGPLARLASRASRTRDPAWARGQTSEYMRGLVAKLRELGVEVPVAHVDAQADGGRQMDVDLPTLAWDAADGLGHVHGHRAALTAHRVGVPLVYGALPASGSVAKAALGARPALWCYTPFCDGPTPGYLGDAAAALAPRPPGPLPAAGEPGAALSELRDLHSFLEPYAADLVDAEPAQDSGTWCPEHIASLAAGGRRFAVLCNESTRARHLPTPEPERCELAAGEVQVRVYDAAGRLEAVSPAPAAATPIRAVPPPLPRLSRWRLSSASPQLDPAYDDESWERIDAAAVDVGRIDLDSLGLHHGFVWYRGVFSGPLDRLIADARHCYSVWVNGRLVASGDQLRNAHGAGPDGAQARVLPVAELPFHEGRNALVVLVESLGHSALLGDAVAPRGLVSVDTGASDVQWRYRGGLVRGERGVAPVVAFEGVERGPSEEVLLPYGWDSEPAGLALFETELELPDLDASTALGLRFDGGRGKANLYLNGHLLGRHWPERPAHTVFPLPWGVLRADEPNHLAIAVWKRAARAALGRVRLVVL